MTNDLERVTARAVECESVAEWALNEILRLQKLSG